ncbi:hypothetical protein Q6297_29455, partial [Klebsiella pneumoniae]|nr:hypothetical protein [Klebsiella pneumoniae]
PQMLFPNNKVYRQVALARFAQAPLSQQLQTTQLAGTQLPSILLVDQGVEHSAGASFAANAVYFDPKYIVELAIEAGCNCV